MTFTEWYHSILCQGTDTWEQREYRYIHCGIGTFAFVQAIPEYICSYTTWCIENKFNPSINITSTGLTMDKGA